MIGVDIFGNQISNGKFEFITIFPRMPAWNMIQAVQIVVIIISAIIGVICGSIYSKLVRGKPTLRQLVDAEKNRLNTIEGDLHGKAVGFWVVRIFTTTMTFVLIGGFLTLAILSLTTFHYAQLAM